MTEIRMYDGSLKMIQDINVGEKLMGDDSIPRNVLKLWRGKSAMYKISPAKGDPFTINGNHKLALKVSQQGNPRIFKSNDTFVINYKVNNIRKSKQFPNENDAILYAKDNLRNYNIYKSTGKYKILWLEIISSTDEDEMVIKNCKKTFDTLEEVNNYKDLIMNMDKVLKYDDNVVITINNIIKQKLSLTQLSLYKVGISYPSSDVEIDPYMFGMWLGDGHSSDSAITTMDNEIVEYFETNAEKYNCSLIANKEKTYKDKVNKALTYRLVSLTKHDSSRSVSNTNLFMNSLRDMNLLNNKHIPESYKINDRQKRLELLAGIIDSDGHLSDNTSGSNNFEVTFKNKKLLENTVELANSLGFSAYITKIKKECCNNGKIGTYYRTNIHGVGIDEIPTKLLRKQAKPYDKERNPLMTSFKIKQVEDDNYYGIEVDNNHLYIMGINYTVTSS
jgi:hypothetical protein